MFLSGIAKHVPTLLFSRFTDTKYKIRNRFRYNAENSPQNIRGYTDIFIQCTGICTSQPAAVRSVAITVSVHVCLSVRMCIPASQKPPVQASPNFRYVLCDHGTVRVWLSYDTACTSGFVDDVIFACT